jgi:hypothetical protein
MASRRNPTIEWRTEDWWVDFDFFLHLGYIVEVTNVQIITSISPGRFSLQSPVSAIRLKERTRRDSQNALVCHRTNFDISAYFNSGVIGLDPDQYVPAVASHQERQLGILETLIPDAERYKETDPLTMQCNHCSAVTPFQRVPEAQVCS